MSKDERTITEQDVEEEHLKGVRIRHHWAYLVGVIGGGLILMILFMVLLDAIS